MPECPMCCEIFIEERGSFWDDTKNTDHLCPQCGYTWSTKDDYDNGHQQTLLEVSGGNQH